MTGANLSGSIEGAILLPGQLKFKIIWSPGNLFQLTSNAFPTFFSRVPSLPFSYSFGTSGGGEPKIPGMMWGLEFLKDKVYWLGGSICAGKEQSGYRGRRTVCPYPCIQNTLTSDFLKNSYWIFPYSWFMLVVLKLVKVWLITSVTCEGSHAVCVSQHFRRWLTNIRNAEAG